MRALESLTLYKIAAEDNENKPNYLIPGAITAAGLGGYAYGAYDNNKLLNEMVERNDIKPGVDKKALKDKLKKQMNDQVQEVSKLPREERLKKVKADPALKRYIYNRAYKVLGGVGAAAGLLGLAYQASKNKNGDY